MDRLTGFYKTRCAVQVRLSRSSLRLLRAAIFSGVGALIARKPIGAKDYASLDPDVRLMLRVRHGDREAFEALTRKYYQRVVSIVEHLMGARSTGRRPGPGTSFCGSTGLERLTSPILSFRPGCLSSSTMWCGTLAERWPADGNCPSASRRMRGRLFVRPLRPRPRHRHMPCWIRSYARRSGMPSAVSTFDSGRRSCSTTTKARVMRRSPTRWRPPFAPPRLCCTGHEGVCGRNWDGYVVT